MYTPRQTYTNIYTHLITLSNKSLDHPSLFNKQKIAFTIFFFQIAQTKGIGKWIMEITIKDITQLPLPIHKQEIAIAIFFFRLRNQRN